MTILAQTGWVRLASDASIFLIVGGLCILGLVVVLVVLRTAFPTGKPRSGGILSGPLPRRAAGTPTLELPQDVPAATVTFNADRLAKGLEASTKAKIDGVDDIFDHLFTNGWGNPRLLRLRQHHAIVRLYECRDCAPGSGIEGQPQQGCAFQAGFLQGSFDRLLETQSKISERLCRAHGAPACEFEVRFP